MARRHGDYQGVRSEGGLLPPDILRRLIDPQRPLVGLEPQDYGLPKNERVTDAITQSWNRLQKHWREFQDARAALPDGEAGTGLTNDRWSLPLLRELGFGLLPTGAGPVINGRTYPIARFAGPTPIHLLGCGLSLDKRAAGQRGAAQHNPHGMVQEYLNRSDAHLWGIVSNGLKLRVLRDNQALSRLSYLEFDLETILDAEAFGDFVILWLVAHATRFHPNEEGKAESCWLERWSQEAEAQGTRALDTLRTGVEKALLTLGQGFSDHPRNVDLRERLRSGMLDERGLHAQLLRVVYRLIFLFVAEDRQLDDRPILHPPVDTPAAHAAMERYAEHYGTARLRGVAGRIKGSRHHDLWRQHQVVVRALHGGSDTAAAREHLALPALGSFLWDPESTRDLNDAHLSNFDLLEALRELAFTRQGNALRPVDYRNLGSEELGSVYEGLLALTPQIGGDGHSFTFAELEGNERKTSGSYYTPTSLVNLLLDSALDPVVEDAVRGKTGADAEKAILHLTVCDPSVGSGHFLIGAAHRLARHLARARAVATGEGEASPPEYQRALRDVIGHCLFGVDLNPMAVELCKVALWLEALEPGKPLSFLDHRIKTGNSLVGLDPRKTIDEVIAEGIPDDAYVALEGDDRVFARGVRDRNRREREVGGAGRRSRQVGLDLQPTAASFDADELAKSIAELGARPDGSLEDIQHKEREYAALWANSAVLRSRKVADSWAAAFLWPKRPTAPVPITTADLFEARDGLVPASDRLKLLNDLLVRHRPFHWRLEFPEPFASDASGFSVVLGNPPWDHIELKEKEWFATRKAGIAKAATTGKRRRLIERLSVDDPVLYAEFLRTRRFFDVEASFCSSSGRFPLCGRGRINTFAVFAELNWQLVSADGRAGFIVPSAIATDEAARFFFDAVSGGGALVSLLDFENRAKAFPGIDSRIKFSLVTLGGANISVQEPILVFFAKNVADVVEPGRSFTLTADEIALLNPNTRTCPAFSSSRDAELVKRIYRRLPVLVDERRDMNPWGLTLRRHFNMGVDAVVSSCTYSVAPPSDFDHVKMLEGKMIHQYDHRFAHYSAVETIVDTSEVEHGDAEFSAAPRFWLPRSEQQALTRRLRRSLDREVPVWALAFRDIARSTDERTVIASIVPSTATDFTIRVAHVDGGAVNTALLLAVFNSFVFDYVARQMVGGTHLSDYITKQLPTPTADAFEISERRFIVARVLELTYTAIDVADFARQAGYSGVPFRWDAHRRDWCRAELDALFFHKYDIDRSDAAYIMDTFPIVERRDREASGSYRTKNTIIEIYDEMARCHVEGRDYLSPLDPPPGPPLDEDGNPRSLEDLLLDPPSHIHLPSELLAKAKVLHLHDLVRVFPPSPFRLLTGTDSGATRVRVTPTPTVNLENGRTVAMACPELRVHGQPVAVAFGVLAIEQRTDANTGQPFVHVTIRGEAGTATARLTHDEWRDMTTIGVVDID